MKRRDFLKKSALVCASTSAPLTNFSMAFAALPGTVTWGGVYLMEDKPNFMPFSRKALQITGKTSPSGQSANETLTNEIQAVEWQGSGIDIRTGIKKKETRYGMVFGLAAEQVLASVFLPQVASTQYILRQIGYLNVYDIFERRIVSCIAVRGRYIDDQPGVPNSEVLPSLFFNLLAQKEQTGSIARFLVEKLKSYQFEEKYQGKYFQVDPVIFSDQAKLHAEKMGVNTDQFGDDTGFAATTAFSEVLRCPLVPYRKTSAINRDMLSEMKIVSSSGNSPLNTSIPLKPADCGVELVHQGWEFLLTSESDTRNEVALVTRINLRFYDKTTGETLLDQGYYGRQDFNELRQAGLSINRKSRLFMLHETILDRAFNGIASEKQRGIIYDGIEIEVTGQKTFVQADAEDWDLFSAECNRVYGMLPRAFGS